MMFRVRRKVGTDQALCSFQRLGIISSSDFNHRENMRLLQLNRNNGPLGPFFLSGQRGPLFLLRVLSEKKKSAPRDALPDSNLISGRSRRRETRLRLWLIILLRNSELR